jgi:hypothetical protein
LILKGFMSEHGGLRGDLIFSDIRVDMVGDGAKLKSVTNDFFDASGLGLEKLNIDRDLKYLEFGMRLVTR